MNDPSSASARRPLVEGATLSIGVVVVLVLYGLVNYLAMRHYQRFDWTSASLYTLSEKSKAVLQDLDRDIDLVFLLDPSSPVYSAVDELADRYVASNPARIARRDLDAAKNLLEVQQLAERYNLERNNVVIVATADDQRVISEFELATYDYAGAAMGQPPVMEAFDGEQKITSAILSLIEAEKPRVVFTTGHGEVGREPTGDLRSLSRAATLLGGDNFALETWSSLGAEAVPDGTDLLVVAGPTTNFLEPELALFDGYLSQGGRMLVFADPSFAPGGGTELADLGLAPWLAGRGVILGADLVIDPSSDLPYFGPETIYTDRYGSHSIVEALEQTRTQVLLPLVRSVRVSTDGSTDGAELTELVLTSDDAWAETGLADLSSVAEDGDDLPGPVSVAVAAAWTIDAPRPDVDDLDADGDGDAAGQGADEGRLVVFGDVDFATDAQIENGANAVLVLNAFNWLVEREALIDIEGRRPEQTRLTLASSELLSIQALLILGLPGLALATGIWIAMRRRR
ncbi:MAG: GldG family protein [Acidobacteriota bacterium]